MQIEELIAVKVTLTAIPVFFSQLRLNCWSAISPRAAA